MGIVASNHYFSQTLKLKTWLSSVLPISLNLVFHHLRCSAVRYRGLPEYQGGPLSSAAEVARVTPFTPHSPCQLKEML